MNDMGLIYHRDKEGTLWAMETVPCPRKRGRIDLTLGWGRHIFGWLIQMLCWKWWLDDGFVAAWMLCVTMIANAKILCLMVATYVTAFDEFLPKQLKFVECEVNFIAQIGFQNVGKFQILIVILRRKRVN